MAGDEQRPTTARGRTAVLQVAGERTVLSWLDPGGFIVAVAGTGVDEAELQLVAELLTTTAPVATSMPVTTTKPEPELKTVVDQATVEGETLILTVEGDKLCLAVDGEAGPSRACGLHANEARAPRVGLLSFGDRTYVFRAVAKGSFGVRFAPGDGADAVAPVLVDERADLPTAYFYGPLPRGTVGGGAIVVIDEDGGEVSRTSLG
ncbi:MAG: hypothetical protein M3R01_01425 [Actinomycetota bacterium]|nr:hypothetical protein [Actinomycetota bacterium]